MSFPIHPDDVEFPRFGNWADDFNTYREACIYYGAEDPEVLRAEAERESEEANLANLDAMEARGGPYYMFNDEIPY
jgi:hypothetical protein